MFSLCPTFSEPVDSRLLVPFEDACSDSGLAGLLLAGVRQWSRKGRKIANPHDTPRAASQRWSIDASEGCRFRPAALNSDLARTPTPKTLSNASVACFASCRGPARMPCFSMSASGLPRWRNLVLVTGCTRGWSLRATPRFGRYGDGRNYKSVAVSLTP